MEEEVKKEEVKKDEFAFTINNKYGKWIAVALTTLSSMGILEYNGMTNFIGDDTPVKVECSHDNTSFGDLSVNLNSKKGVE